MMDKYLCGACSADGSGCTFEPHEKCGFQNILEPEIERLQKLLDQITYVSRKASLTDAEKVSDIRGLTSSVKRGSSGDE